MTQEETITFLSQHGIDVEHMSYNEVNFIMDVANKVAEESFKECLLTFCECNHPVVENPCIKCSLNYDGSCCGCDKGREYKRIMEE